VYATGMSAREIHALLAGTDWTSLFSPAADYTALPFRRKEDAWQYPVRFELGLHDGVHLPVGLNPGQHVGMLLSRLALPCSARDSFDMLPTPFRCTAVDLNTAQEVIFAGGSLAAALRATMAIPGVFDPVRVGDQVLVDGGVLDNVPVEVARGMGADVVVAVEVMAVDDRAPLEDLFGLAERSLGVMMGALARPGLATADLVLDPDLHGLSTDDFSAVDVLAARGWAAAAADSAFLSRFAVTPAVWEEYLAARRARRPSAAFVPAFVEVRGLAGRPARIAQARLATMLGQPLDTAKLERTLEEITGAGRAASALYAIVPRGDRVGLRVDLQPRLHAPPWMRFGIDAHNRDVDVDFDVGARVTFLDPTSAGSEWRLDVVLGTNLAAGSELLQPLGTPRLWIAPRVLVGRTMADRFVDGAQVARYERRRAAVGGDLGLLPGSKSELRAGYEIGWVGFDRRIGLPAFPESDGRDQQLRLRFAFDGLDCACVPRQGMRAEAKAAWFTEAPSARRDFGQFEARETVAVPLGRDGTLRLTGEAGASVGGPVPPAYAFTLGGPGRLTAFQFEELRGRHLALGRLEYQFVVARLGHVTGERVLLSAAGEIGSAFDSKEAAQAEFCGTAGVLVETLLGPGFAGLSVGTSGTRRIYVSFGHLAR
jgi:NTE family protein